jgi:hypothetical protein
MSDNEKRQLLRDWYISERALNNRKKDYFIRQLVNKGMAQEKAEILIDSIDREYQAMMKEDPFEPNYTFKSWRWLIALLVLIIVWAKLIPFGVYYPHVFMYSLMGAVVGSVLLGKFLLSVRTPVDYLGQDDKRKIDRHKYSWFMFIPGLILLFIFFQVRSSQRQDLLRTEGIITTAQVVGGHSKHSESFSLRRGKRSNNSYNLRLSVNLEDGKTIEVKKSVQMMEYLSSFEGQTKPVVYLRDLPNEIEMLMISDDPAPYNGPRTESYEAYILDIERHAIEANAAYLESMAQERESWR